MRQPLIADLLQRTVVPDVCLRNYFVMSYLPSGGKSCLNNAAPCRGVSVREEVVYHRRGIKYNTVWWNRPSANFVCYSTPGNPPLSSYSPFQGFGAVLSFCGGAALYQLYNLYANADRTHQLCVARVFRMALPVPAAAHRWRYL